MIKNDLNHLNDLNDYIYIFITSHIKNDHTRTF